MNIEKSLQKFQKNITAKYKWKIKDHIIGYYKPIFNAECLHCSKKYICLLMNNLEEQKTQDLLQEISKYKIKNRVKNVSILEIFDFIKIKNISYVFYEKLPSIKKSTINEKRLLETLLSLNLLFQNINFDCLYLTETIYMKNENYFIDIRSIGREIVLKPLENDLYEFSEIFRFLDSNFSVKINLLIEKIKNKTENEKLKIIQEEIIDI